MRIGILSSGGDCPGINATIRGVGKTAIMHYGMEVVGIHSGFKGLMEKDYQTLDEQSLSGILNLGGTILGTSREKPFRKMLAKGDPDKPLAIRRHYEELGLDCLVCIGGNGTQKTAGRLSAKRVMVVEVMGHHAGWIALYAGMAGGADVIMLPEIPYDMERICAAILDRSRRGKPCSIVVVAEGIKTPVKSRPSDYVSEVIESVTGLETRNTVLGYTQRGGNPSPFDRNLATRLGGHATELIANGQYGRMVCLREGKIDSLPLAEVAGKLKLVTPDHDLIKQGERMGILFG